jgi:adenylate cyclase
VPDLDEPAIDEPEMEAWRMLKVLLDAGLPEEDLHELGRTVGRAAAQMTETVIEVFVRAFRREDDTEHDFALRLADLFANLSPTIGPLTETPLRMHLRDRFRNEALRSATGTRQVAVAFADLVGFTRLAEAANAQELSRVTGRLELLAADVARSPVRLIKLIGDAVMLVAPEPAPLVAAVSELVARAESEGLPPLRAGLAAGEALNHGGDWYGPPVNLASRITGAAAPGEVLANDPVAGDASAWEPAGERRLKGIEAPVRLYALRRSASPTSIG